MKKKDGEDVPLHYDDEATSLLYCHLTSELNQLF
jgi:hypothetical protein